MKMQPTSILPRRSSDNPRLTAKISMRKYVMRYASILFVCLVVSLMVGCAGGDQCQTDTDCDDGIWCNGTERCGSDPFFGLNRPVFRCRPAPFCPCGGNRFGPVRDCQELCNEEEMLCECDRLGCNDGRFCNGEETCATQADTGEAVCVAGTAPCAVGESCNEDTDTCNQSVACTSDADCDDGTRCTTDSCRPETGCSFVPVDCQQGEFCDPGTGACAPTLFSVTATENANISSTLITIDPTTASQTQVGPEGETIGMFAMDADPVSRLFYGVDQFDDAGPSVIHQIDPSTGISTPIATITQDGSTFQMCALAFSPDGTLYASKRVNWPQRGFEIGRVDLLAQTFESVMEETTENVTSIAGMDFSPSGVLYAVVKEQCPGFSSYTLATIDVGSAEITWIGPVTRYAIGDIDYASHGSIYATNFSWALIRIDPIDAMAKIVGFGELGALNGIASLPPTEVEPSNDGP